MEQHLLCLETRIEEQRQHLIKTEKTNKRNLKEQQRKNQMQQEQIRSLEIDNEHLMQEVDTLKKSKMELESKLTIIEKEKGISQYQNLLKEERIVELEAIVNNHSQMETNKL